MAERLSDCIPTEVEVTRDGITASVWVKRGVMIVRRDALDYDDPESYWRLWWDRFGELLPDWLIAKVWPDMPLTDDEKLTIRQTLRREAGR